MLASALAVVAGNAIARGEAGRDLIVTAAVAALVTGAGNILNDCFDLEIDRINKPERPLPSGRMTPQTAMQMYTAISTAATAAAGWLLPRPVAAVIVAWQLVLAVYARWAKPRFVVGNLMVAAISSSAFLVGAMLAHNVRAAIIPTAIAFVFVLCREIVKGVEDVIGDRKGGVSTFALVLGAERAGTVAAVLMLLLAALLPVPALTVHYRASYLLIMELMVAPALLSSAIRVAGSRVRRDFTLTSRMLKLGMFLGIAAIWLGA
jgi:geranylgeranylglycerol-phosphate geranylgeranyltransferase